MKKRADRLALGDIWDRKGLPCQIVAVGFRGLEKKEVKIAYQDPYTPPEIFKEDLLDSDQEVEVTEPQFSPDQILESQRRPPQEGDYPA